MGEGWDRVGVGWDRVREVWERVGEGWERGLGEGWERVKELWERVGEAPGGGGLGSGRQLPPQLTVGWRPLGGVGRGGGHWRGALGMGEWGGVSRRGFERGALREARLGGGGSRWGDLGCLGGGMGGTCSPYLPLPSL